LAQSKRNAGRGDGGLTTGGGTQAGRLLLSCPSWTPRTQIVRCPRNRSNVKTGSYAPRRCALRKIVTPHQKPSRTTWRAHKSPQQFSRGRCEPVLQQAVRPGRQARSGNRQSDKNPAQGRAQASGRSRRAHRRQPARLGNRARVDPRRRGVAQRDPRRDGDPRRHRNGGRAKRRVRGC